MAFEHFRDTNIKREHQIKINGVVQSSLANVDVWFQGVRNDNTTVNVPCVVSGGKYSFYYTDWFDENVHTFVRGKLFFRFNAGHTVTGIADGNIHQSDEFRVDVIA
jgi:hypothetical protein